MMRSHRAALQQLARVGTISQSSVAGPSLPRAISTRRQFSKARPLFATSTTPYSTWKDPAIDEAQRQLELGSAALEAGNISDAKHAYMKAVEISESASAHFNLGVCHYHEREIDKAIDSWTQTLRISPESADAHTNLASAYVMSSPSRPDLAVDHLKKASSITPDDPEVQFNLGAVLEAVEQLEESIRAYQRAYDGGIDRAMENIRNVKAKILSVKFGPKPKEIEEMEKKQDL